MVLSCHALTNGRLHQSRQGREHVDGGIDLGAQKVWQKARSRLSLLPTLLFPTHPMAVRGPPSSYREVGHTPLLHLSQTLGLECVGVDM